MVKVNLLTKKTVAQILKQKKIEAAKATKAAKDAAFNSFVKKTAQSILKNEFPRYSLKIGENSDSFNKAAYNSEHLTDSIWAPWIDMTRKGK